MLINVSNFVVYSLKDMIGYYNYRTQFDVSLAKLYLDPACKRSSVAWKDFARDSRSASRCALSLRAFTYVARADRF